MYCKGFGGLLVWISWLNAVAMSLSMTFTLSFIEWFKFILFLFLINLFHLHCFPFYFVERMLAHLFLQCTFLHLANKSCLLIVACIRVGKVIEYFLSHSQWTFIACSPFIAHSSVFTHCTYLRPHAVVRAFHSVGKQNCGMMILAIFCAPYLSDGFPPLKCTL